MLPFLEPKKMASVLMTKHTDKGNEPLNMEGEHPPELMQAAQDLIKAVESKDASAVCDALCKAMGKDK